MPFIPIAKTEDVPLGKGICVKVGRKSIALFHVNSNYYALDDYCPHQGAPIANGYLTAKDVTCTWHGATFDLATGKGLSGPCGAGITPYPVRVSDGVIEIEVSTEISNEFSKLNHETPPAHTAEEDVDEEDFCIDFEEG